MTVGIKRLRRRGVGRKSISRVIFTVLLIIMLSPLISCMPRSTPFPVPATDQGPAVTASELASATPTIPPSVTEVTAPVGLPTETSTPANISFSFMAEADAWVDEANPNENNGDAETLRSDGEGDGDLETFIRFTVSGISGSVQSARLRVYATNASRNGPSVYLTDPTWVEADLTWHTRPERQGAAIDNKDRINEETWVEYDITSQAIQNGTLSFAFVPDSGDGIAFSSREGSYPPELVITTGHVLTPTPAPTVPAGAEILVGAGDISICSNDNDELTAKLLDAIPGTVFTTGDNAYGSGTYAQFMECYEPTWGRHKDRTKPVPGNHDYRSSDGAGYFQYFEDIPEYYAYDLGSWRIYALNTEIDVSLDSPQVIWLLADLFANPRQCVLAYWHHPRWSSGATHGSDRSLQTLWEVFYEAGAELVLNGHQHSYERFMPMDASGQPDPQGMRAIVVGTGGRSLYQFGTPLSTTEVRDNTSYGVLKLTLYDGGYTWEFIPAAGSTFTDSGSAECR